MAPALEQARSRLGRLNKASLLTTLALSIAFNFGALNFGAWENNFAFAETNWQVGKSLDTSALDARGWTASEPRRLSKLDLQSLFDEERCLILKEFGILSFFGKTLSRGNRRIEIYIYEFEQDSGAMAAYFYLRKGAGTVVRRGDASSEEDASISFVQGRYFVSVSATEDDDESKDVVKRLCDELGKRLGPAGSSQPEIMKELPLLDKLSGSERLVFGVHSARWYSSAPGLEFLFDQANAPGQAPSDAPLAKADSQAESKDLVGGEVQAVKPKLENAQTVKAPIIGVLADYLFREPVKERLRLLILAYPDRSSALQHYTLYIDKLRQFRLGKVADSPVTASELFKTGTSIVAVELRGNKIAIVTGAKKRFSPALLVRQWKSF
ncbi:MAG: hypothetical protein J0M35_14135 [Candidatus Obscuribacter phosphatis]|uniref:Uncharacterized protein n=1 Tax=Candidatus Obscuribacter phosphatis TaxID=1906157 RepID=A0A8J7PMK0_9BACT|nr:hypothetical protein [Candidatus Obscuribacter phosphatis]